MRILDAKGRPVLSEEEKAAKEAKDRAKREEKARVREERIKKLVDNLERKLSIFTESATGPNDPDVASSWRTICALEAECVVSAQSFRYTSSLSLQLVNLSKNRTASTSYKLSDLCTFPKPSTTSQRTRPSSGSVGGCTTCKANITSSAKRTFAFSPHPDDNNPYSCAASRRCDLPSSSNPCLTRSKRPSGQAT